MEDMGRAAISDAIPVGHFCPVSCVGSGRGWKEKGEGDENGR